MAVECLPVLRKCSKTLCSTSDKSHSDTSATCSADVCINAAKGTHKSEQSPARW